MDYVNPQALVSTEWLAEHLSDPTVKIFDCTSFLPNVPRNGREENLENRIPGSVFFDINDVADLSNPLPHMLPDAETFSQKVGALGVSKSDKVVVYDQHGGPSASMRVWWTFRVFGHENVAVLNGSLPKWLAEGRPMENGPYTITPVTYGPCTKDNSRVRSFDQVLANIESKTELFVDARSQGRFLGLEAEPREGSRRGHVPGSANLPFIDLLDKTKNFTFRSADEIKEILEEDGIPLDKPLISSCGSGVTACVLVLALFLLGLEDIAVYDGSWAEWGDRSDTPIDT